MSIYTTATNVASTVGGTFGSSGLVTVASRLTGLSVNGMIVGAPTKIQYKKASEISTKQKTTFLERLKMTQENDIDAQTSVLPLDIVKSVEIQFGQEIASHPVEDGFEISDHIINKPIELQMTAGVSSHPVTWYYQNGRGKSKFNTAYDALLDIRKLKEPVSIIRTSRKYDNMVLTSCKLRRSDESLSVIWVDLTFKEIIKVKVQSTTIPQDIVDASIKDKAGETAQKGDGGMTDLTAHNTDIYDEIKSESGSLLWHGTRTNFGKQVITGMKGP